MLFSMLADSSAAAHGHEFSRPAPTPSATQPQPRRRSPLSVFPSTRQRSPHGPSPLGPGRRASTPVRSSSIKPAMEEVREEPDEDLEPENMGHDHDFLSAFPMPGAFHGSMTAGQTPQASSNITKSPIELPAQTALSQSEPSLVHPTIEPPVPTSLEEPDVITSNVAPSLKGARGPRTTLRFAHPPPPTRPLGKKGILRPKILLQLQQRGESGFHKPIYEVVPANRFAPSTKLGQKLRRLHRGKDGLEADDLLVVNAEDYNVSDSSSEEFEFSESKAPLGIISPPSASSSDPAAAWFSLDNAIWRITAGANGASYNVELQGENPTTARWYIPKRKRNSITTGSTAAPIGSARKFYCTTILPNTKQHPTVASMTETNLEIYERYTSTIPEDEGRVLETDEFLRKLIVVSAAWVYFMEGWSTTYKVDQDLPGTPKPIHSRTLSMPVESTRRRSLFASCPSRSPSFQAPAEGQISPVVSISKSPSLEPHTSPETSTIAESTTVSDRKTSQASQVTSTAGTEVSQDLSSELDTTAAPPTSNPVEIRSHLPSQAFTPRPRPTGSVEDQARKRRSWSHHDFAHHDWQGTLRTLSRSMSIRPKRERPSIIPGDEEAPQEQERGLRHVRRMSHKFGNSKSTKKDSANVATVLSRPVTPMRLSHPFTPASRPTSRPSTAKSIAGTEIINIEQVASPPYPVTETALVEKPLLSPPSPVHHVMAVPAAQSTETLPDPGQFTYWQQYDRFIEQHQEIRLRQLERQVSPPVQQPQEREVGEQKIQALAATTSVSSTSASPAGSGRFGSWKEKLKTKLHV